MRLDATGLTTIRHRTSAPGMKKRPVPRTVNRDLGHGSGSASDYARETVELISLHDPVHR